MHLNNKVSGTLKKQLIHPIKRRVAKYYLIILRKLTNLKVIGITGSCGKTTTKEMLVSILKLKGETVYSHANIDPVYNIPTTILKCRPGTKYLVLEMGVEYPGEMDYYLWLATPDIGVITNVYPTHTEFFKSVEGVLEEKSKLARHLSKESLIVLNKDNPHLETLGKSVKARVKWFRGKGDPQNKNKRAAEATAEVLGYTKDQIERGLKNYVPQPHRLRLINHSSGAVIMDDSYNNNPVAAAEAIRYFAKRVGERKKIIVFGDMLELGDSEKKYHQEIGILLTKLSFDKIFCVGRASREIKGKNVVYYDSWEEAVLPVRRLLVGDMALLVKGSRAIGLDKLVDALLG